MSQPHYSQDEDYFNQNQQQHNNKPRKNNLFKIDQPDNIYQSADIFERCMNQNKHDKHNDTFLSDKIWHNQKYYAITISNKYSRLPT